MSATAAAIASRSAMTTAATPESTRAIGLSLALRQIMFPESLLAERTRLIELSGIRRVFELGKTLKDPVDLSIGQPHFEVPEPIKAAAKAAIDSGRNGYTVTQGIPELRDKL